MRATACEAAVYPLLVPHADHRDDYHDDYHDSVDGYRTLCSLEYVGMFVRNTADPVGPTFF